MNGITEATEIERFEARAVDPVAQLLVRRLSVPNIYFAASWPTEEVRIDILAVDRAGVSDVHVVKIVATAAAAIELAPGLLAVPAHYRWLAFPRDTVDRATEARILAREGLYPPEGAGRIGLIGVVRKIGDDLTAEVILSAERFRGFYREQAKAFVASHTADIDFNE